jgi:hypothetical protein
MVAVMDVVSPVMVTVETELQLFALMLLVPTVIVVSAT